MDTPQSIISDAQIEQVHAHANFGGMAKRQVVNEGVLKAAFGYGSGHTQMTILHEHGLIRDFRKAKGNMNLTAKGLKYLRAVYGSQFDQIKKLGAS